LDQPFVYRAVLVTAVVILVSVIILCLAQQPAQAAAVAIVVDLGNRYLLERSCIMHE